MTWCDTQLEEASLRTERGEATPDDAKVLLSRFREARAAAQNRSGWCASFEGCWCCGAAATRAPRDAFSDIRVCDSDACARDTAAITDGEPLDDLPYANALRTAVTCAQKDGAR